MKVRNTSDIQSADKANSSAEVSSHPVHQHLKALIPFVQILETNMTVSVPVLQHVAHFECTTNQNNQAQSSVGISPGQLPLTTNTTGPVAFINILSHDRYFSPPQLIPYYYSNDQPQQVFVPCPSVTLSSSIQTSTQNQNSCDILSSSKESAK